MSAKQPPVLRVFYTDGCPFWRPQKGTKRAWLAENGLSPALAPLKFIKLALHSSGSGMINFGRFAIGGLRAAII